LCEVDSSFNGILNGNKPSINIAARNRIKHVWHTAIRHQFRRSKISLRQQSLFGESTEWAKEPDALWWCCHEKKGYAVTFKRSG
jgi:hypothetical protein